MKIQLKVNDITYRDLNPCQKPSGTLKIILEFMIGVGLVFLISAGYYIIKIITEITTYGL